jgi:hypothetical protein
LVRDNGEHDADDDADQRYNVSYPYGHVPSLPWQPLQGFMPVQDTHPADKAKGKSRARRGLRENDGRLSRCVPLRLAGSRAKPVPSPGGRPAGPRYGHRRYTVLESATPGARPVSSDRLDRGHGGSYLLASLVLASAPMAGGIAGDWRLFHI